jgi:Fe-S oxidoreductase
MRTAPFAATAALRSLGRSLIGALATLDGPCYDAARNRRAPLFYDHIEVFPILHTTATLAAVLAAFTFMGSKLFRIAALINMGRHDEVYTDYPRSRWRMVLEIVFGHQKTLEDRVSGMTHIAFIYGFLILGFGHTEIVIEGLTMFVKTWGSAPFTYDKIPGLGHEHPLIHAYWVSQDGMASLVLLAVSVAFARRVFFAPPRLRPRSLDAEIILYFIGALYVTFFMLQGAHLVRELRPDVHFVQWKPFTSLMALWMAALPASVVDGIYWIFWWAHVAVFLSFGCYIPLSKHMHLVFAGPNTWFFKKGAYMWRKPEVAAAEEKKPPAARARAMGIPPKIDFDTAEKYGTDRIQELPWKTLLDSFACTECGRCNNVCPAHLTGKPLKPKKVLHDLKVNLLKKNGAPLYGMRDSFGRPQAHTKELEAAVEPVLPLISKAEIDRGHVSADGTYVQVDGQIHVDDAWACTTCGACFEACPVLIDSVPASLIGIRQHLVMMESEFPKELTAAFKGMERQGNPWGTGQDKREEWAAGLDVPTMASIKDREVEYLFWVGCAGATDDNAKKVQQALTRVLKAAKVDFAILGCEEKCNGDPARRMGNEAVWNQLAQENIATLAQYKFKRIFTTCPHCLNALGTEYGELGVDYEVLHHSQLVAQLLKDKRIPLDAKKALDEHVTFHDPCYLGRYAKEYNAPRDVLVSIGTKNTEMKRNQESSFCCGAGGGRMFVEEHIGTRVNVDRTKQALATGATTIAVGCPFCKSMIVDGTKSLDMDEKIKVKDIAELVAERLA